jgi:hypothetical protein
MTIPPEWADIAAIELALSELGKQHQNCTSGCTTRLIVEQAEEALRRLVQELQPAVGVGQ